MFPPVPSVLIQSYVQINKTEEVTDGSRVYLDAVEMEPVLTGLQLLVVRVAWHQGVQADAALVLLVLLNRSSLHWPPSDLSSSPSSPAEGDWSGLTTDCPEAFLPEFLHASQDVVAVELVAVLLSRDLDVINSLLLL